MRTWLPLLAFILLVPARAPGQSFLGKSEADWLKNLTDKDARARRSAVHALGKIGQAGSRTLSALLDALNDPEPAVRDAAAFALGEVAANARNAGRVWRQAGDKLQAKLNDDDPRVRRSAAFALGCCEAGAGAEAALLRALGDRQATVRQAAAGALGKAGKESSAEAVRALIRALEREEELLALRDLAGALGMIGRPTASDAAEPMARLFQTQRDPVVRRTALTSLLTLVGPEMAKAPAGTHDALVKALRDAFLSGDPEMKGLIAGAFDALGDHAAPALVDLADLVDDDRAPVASRRNAVIALTKMWPTIRKMPLKDGQAITRKLARALDPTQPVEVRRFTAEALARIKFPQVAPAAPALLNAIEKDADKEVRQRAIWTFFELDDLDEVRGAQEVIRKALKDPAKTVRYDAARCLARALMARAGEDVIDTLDEMIHDPEIKVYNQTNTSVKGGSESSGGQSSIEKDLGGDGRFMAAQALGFIGAPVAKRERVLKTLKEMVTSKEEHIRKSAAQALQRIGG